MVLSDREAAEIRRALRERQGGQVAINLHAQTVTDPAGRQYRFLIPPVRRKSLLEGLDDVARTERYRERIEAFEAGYRNEHRWLYEEVR